MSWQWRSHSPAETQAIAVQLATLLPADAIVQLTGNLGAGKTTLIAGLVEALGVAPADQVTSPTFSLIHEYGDPVRIYHLDLYRLEEPHELFTLGLEELYDSGRLVLIEWGEKFAAQLPANRWRITLLHDGEQGRQITLQAPGDF